MYFTCHWIFSHLYKEETDLHEEGERLCMGTEGYIVGLARS